MPSISKLLEQLPEIQQSRLVASGYGIWIAWKGSLNNAVENTFREYGAMGLARSHDQALYFCNTTEIFRALARLQIWARVNPIPVFCQVFPMTFLVGYQMESAVSIAAELEQQEASPNEEFEVVIHPKLQDAIKNVNGLSSSETAIPGKLANVKWHELKADQGLDYETDRKWYFIIKPLGRMADKEAILGWRDFSQEIFELLQKRGLKYISDVKDGFVFFPLDNFQLLRSFCGEMLQLIQEVKEDPERKYWPVVMVALLQGDLPFSTELPKKAGLDWNRLAPDFPHVRFMDGFLLQEWFQMVEVRYGTDVATLDSWCTLALKEGGDLVAAATMQVALPNALVKTGEADCYYCGQKSHPMQACPSRHLGRPHPEIWQQLARVDLDDFSKGFNSIDTELAEKDYVNGMGTILESVKSLEGVLAHAVFEINSPCQLRMLKRVWRSRDKEWGDGIHQVAEKEGQYIWEALAAFESGDFDGAEELLKQAQAKYPRSYQPHSLWGFWHLEKEDYTQAAFHWEEAERMSYTPLQQGYLAYLRARLLETEGNLKESINVYKQVNTYSPMWIDPAYRQGVCMVKMGFTGQAMDLFSDLIGRDPSIFNRIVVDPELDRGRVQLMSALGEQWAEVETEAKEVRQKVQDLTKDIDQRFDENHNYFDAAHEELERLKRLGETSNYVAYRLLLRGTEKFSSQLDAEVQREIKRMEANLDYLTARVRDIQKEAAWFPFPKLLREFNKDFNYSVDKINWIRTQRIKDAHNFRKASRFVEEIEDRIDSLQERLVTLRIIRDSTLFVLMLGRNFIWFELVGLGLALIAIPATLYFTQGIHGNWIIDAIREQQWEFTKGLVIILSVLCLGVAAIKSAFTFDKRKRELFDQLDEELRDSAPRRY